LTTTELELKIEERTDEKHLFDALVCAQKVQNVAEYKVEVQRGAMS
jgi:hypothetical protein